jgi:hypothetical protein
VTFELSGFQRKQNTVAGACAVLPVNGPMARVISETVEVGHRDGEPLDGSVIATRISQALSIWR